ncbi:hypothetical protein [Luteibacter sp.]|jgi:hypothetical protein|uniref:hypothetical protein n=1 Tax=Luteibacter sp. TaxID=1886636 RepID=UPI002F42ABFB
MTPRKTIFAMLSLTMLIAAPAEGRGGTVVIEDMDLDKGNVTALLEQTSQYYVDAMTRLVAERYPDEYRPIRWEDLETAMTRNRVARVEYHFRVAGEERVRVYHAMGGEPLGIIGESIFEGPTRPVTPDTLDPSEDSGEGASETSAASRSPAQREAADVADEAFFTTFDDIDVRARVLPMDGSSLEPFQVEGWQGELDAELKALRHIEHDITTGSLPRGGRIDAKVGDILCQSCTEAMRSMAETYDVDIRATQIYRTLPSTKQKVLIQSGKARLSRGRLVDVSNGRPLLAEDALTGAREAQVRRSLSPRAMGRTFKGMSWQGRSFKLGASSGPFPSPHPEEGRRPNHSDVEEPRPPEC